MSPLLWVYFVRNWPKSSSVELKKDKVSIVAEIVSAIKKRQQ